MRVRDLQFMALGNYAVRDDGVVFNITRLTPLKPDINQHGYARVRLVNDEGEAGSFSVHRLVAEAFVSNPESKPHVHHRDFNRLNNCSSNLLWVYPHENSEFSSENFPRGPEHHNCKLTSGDISYIQASGLPSVTLSQMLGVSRQSIAYWKRKE